MKASHELTLDELVSATCPVESEPQAKNKVLFQKLSFSRGLEIGDQMVVTLHFKYERDGAEHVRNTAFVYEPKKVQYYDIVKFLNEYVTDEIVNLFKIAQLPD